jgi:hypothetical protein
MGMGIDWSVAEAWKPLADEALAGLGERPETVTRKSRGWLPGVSGRPFAWKRKHKEKRRHVEPPPIEGELEDLS